MKTSFHEIEIQRMIFAHVPAKHRDVSMLSFSDEQIKVWAKPLSVYCLHEPRKNLLLTSMPEGGKTSVAVLVLKSLLARNPNWTAAYVSLQDLTSLYFARDKREEADDLQQNFAGVMKSTVLVIDDCESHQNEGCATTLDYVYRRRERDLKLTIIACESDETGEPILSREFGVKLASKIINTSTHVSL